MSSETEFLEAYLDDIEKLEIAYLLWKRQTPIARDELAETLRIPTSLISEVLGALAQSDVIALAGTDVALGARATEPGFLEPMAQYDEDRFSVLAIVSRIAMDRARAMAARAFSDAFVLRKKPGGQDE